MTTEDFSGDEPTRRPAKEPRRPTNEELELGLIGRLFGGTHAPSNIAGLVAVGCLLMVAYAFFGTDVPAELVDTAKTLLLTSLAYLFGRSTAPKSEPPGPPGVTAGDRTR